MTRTVFGNAMLALVVLATLAWTSTVSSAAETSGETARTIPTDVFELLVGGSWEQGKMSGYYRAVALAAGETGNERAEVWLQWISVNDKNAATVIANTPVTEITKLNIPSLTLAMDVEESGSVILIVTRYDEKTDEPFNLEFRAEAPGKYVPLETQAADAPSGEIGTADKN